jgi:small subunit ribosomal protein S25e
MGKTDKQKANEKAKGAVKAKAKDKVPKILKPGSGAPKKKKWSSSKQKEKLNLTVFWTQKNHEKLVQEIIAHNAYVTPSIVSDKLKINVSCAREALKELLDNGVIQPSVEYNAKYCCFVKGPKFQQAEVKKPQKTGKGGDKKEKAK